MKYFLTFTPDRGNREDCSVYYSHLVIANDAEEAKEKFKNHMADMRIKYLKKNNHPIKDEVTIRQSIIDSISFVDSDSYDEETGQEWEIMEIKPIQ